MEEKRKRYLTAAVVYLFLVIIFSFFEKVYSQSEITELLVKAANAFTVPAVIYVFVGGLSRLSAWGAYDSLGYITSFFSLHNIIPAYPQKKHYDSLYDYKAAKDEKGRKWLPEVLVVGLAGLVIAIVITAFYYILQGK